MSVVYSCNGMAATFHPLATLGAVDVLRNSGNAVDAAGAVHCVAEPQSTGLGGDCCVLIVPRGLGEVIGPNGSGRPPAAAAPDSYIEQGTRKSAGIHRMWPP